MTNQQILEKAIQKAIDGGWQDPFGIVQFKLEHGCDDDQWMVAHTAICIRQYSRNTKNMEDKYYQFELFIYRHDFAKALWGENNMKLHLSQKDFTMHNFPTWKWHLQQMVIAPDPIQYLGEHV